MSLAPALGRFNYYRGKGQQWVDLVRSWVTPAAAAGAFTKYLGFSGSWALAVAIVVPVLVECVGFFLGRFLYRAGGVRADYQLAADADPYKVEHLRIAGETAKDLRALRILVGAVYQALRRPPAP